MTTAHNQGSERPKLRQEEHAAFAARLKQLMKQHRLDQQGVADGITKIRGGKPLTYQAVGKWVRKSWPGGEYVAPLATVLETDIWYLLTGQEPASTGVERADAVEVAKEEIRRQVLTALDGALAQYATPRKTAANARASVASRNQRPSQDQEGSDS